MDISYSFIRLKGHFRIMGIKDDLMIDIWIGLDLRKVVILTASFNYLWASLCTATFLSIEIYGNNKLCFRIPGFYQFYYVLSANWISF